MPPLDFPNNPTTGQIFLNWQWTGSVWETNPVAAGVQAGPGLKISTSTTPPTIDVVTPYLPISGGAMTGTLAMGANNITGTGTVSATTFVGALTGHASLDLPLAGGTLSGPGNLTVNGSLGIGTTQPSDMAAGGILAAMSLTVLGGGSILATNAYQTTSGWKLLTANPASVLNMSGGGYQFYTAPSAAAGTSTAWTQIVSIAANGNLNITGNYSQGGQFHSFIGGSATLSGGGPVVYGDANWIVVEPGTGNAGFMVYNHSGSSVHQLRANGDAQFNGSVYPGGHIYLNNAYSLYGYDTGGAAQFLCSFWSDNNAYFGDTAHNSHFRGATITFENAGASGNLNFPGNPRTYGGNAGWIFADRSGGFDWQWYGSGSICRLWSSADGDRVTIDRGGSIVAQGNISISNNNWFYTGGGIQLNGMQWSNNGGWMYTPNSLQTNGDLQSNSGVLRLAGMYWQNNSGYMYCPWPIHTDNYINIAGLIWQNSSGMMYCGSTLRVNGMLPLSDNNNSVGLTGQAWAQVATYWLNQQSSRALKDDIAPLSNTLDRVLALHPVEFRWKRGENRKLHSGFIADEVAVVMGEDFGGYDKAENGGEGLAYNELTAILWKAVQELATEVMALKEARA